MLCIYNNCDYTLNNKIITIPLVILHDYLNAKDTFKNEENRKGYTHYSVII